MTVKQLKEILERMPEDACIRIRHELIGDDEFDLASVEYDGIFVLMRETDD